MTIPVLDARDVYCPELFLVMRRFINSRPDEKFIQVNTKEERARKRLEHFCSEYSMSLHEQEVSDGYCFVVERSTGAN